MLLLLCLVTFFKSSREKGENHPSIHHHYHYSMSEGYASRLKEYPNKGVCGLPERRETQRAWNRKVGRLADYVQESKRVVILTGAGISTSSGIPDFRGPSGIWTQEQKKEKIGKKRKKESEINKNNTTGSESNTDSDDVSSQSPSKRARGPVVMDFAAAKPTLTHRAITKLVEMGLVQFCITQNVDGLHRRSGLSRAKHAVLHGCVFTETCEDCHMEHFRDKDVGGMSFQKTGRKCELCKGDLRDTLLDWEDELPEEDYQRSVEECEKADLVICLGTSLRIQPAGSLPTLAKKFAIVNLQETPYDSEASLIIRGRVDEVMQKLMEHLGCPEWDKDYPYKAPEIERLSLQPGKRERKDDSL